MKTKIQWYAIEQVKAIRKACGFSQKDVADWLLVSTSFIQQVESEKKNCAYNLNHLNMIASELDWSLREFVPNGYFEPEE